jgi:predicted permease
MDWSSRIRTVLTTTTPAPDDDVVEELAQHAAAMYQSARAEGLSEADAARAVEAQVEGWRAEGAALRRRVRRTPVVEPPPAVATSRIAGVTQDLRYAARLLRRQPRAAFLAVLTMALGIGATTVLFSVTYGVLLKPLPWPNADRLIVLKETRGGNAPRFGSFTNAAYFAWSEAPSTVTGIAAWSQRMVTLTGSGDAERIRITTATADLFPVLGVTPLIGTVFGRQDERNPVIVLAEGFWRERFGADPAVLGRTVHLDGHPFTVIGVLADRANFPDRQSRAIVPFVVPPATGNTLALFEGLAALAPGATPAQAEAEGTTRGKFAADTGLTTTAIFGGAGPLGITAQPLRDALAAEVRTPLIVLLAAVALLLATATANVASVQLARTNTRVREMAIRAALGAGSARVTRQLLTENLVLGAIGGAAGLALAWLLHRLLPTLLPADFPRIDDLGLDAAVIAFALVVSLAAGVVFGFFPALLVRRRDLVPALAKDGPAAGAGGARSRTAQARMLIMAAQVAIACVLLVGASLLGRSFVALVSADRGYDPADVHAARLSMPEALFPAPERRFALIEQVLRRLEGTPGMSSVAITTDLPLAPGATTAGFQMKSPEAEGGTVQVQASPRVVSPRYFNLLGMRVSAGRTFTDEDTEASEPVVIVNGAFARRYLGRSPLGARIPMAFGPSDDSTRMTTVIGILDDVRYVAASEASHPELYYSYRQLGGRLPVQSVTLLARTAEDGARVASAMRLAVREADEQVALDPVLPLSERLLTTLARPRLYAALLGAFAVCAVVIAAVGLFGVMSYSVSQRSRELAIRVALGARRADILRLVLQQGLGVTVAGLAAGVLASLWLTRLLAAQLFGISPHDAWTFAAVPVFLVAIGTLACLFPARRAATLDPLRLLRSE